MYLLREKIHSSSVKAMKLDNSCNFSDPQELSSAFNDHVSSIDGNLSMLSNRMETLRLISLSKGDRT